MKKIKILPIILLIFSCQCNLLAMTTDVNSELVSAIKEGSIEKVYDCIQREADVNFVTDNGNTPLIYAVWGFEPSEEIVYMLIAHGADVNYCRVAPEVTTSNATPLIFAVKNKNVGVGIIRLLIDNGADVDHVAIFRRANETALLCAIFFGRSLEIVSLIMDNSLDVDFVDSYEKTAIFYVEKLPEGRRRTDLMNLFRQNR